MEVIADAKIVVVHMKCDTCGKGLMVADLNVVLGTFPPKYTCTCDHCGAVDVYLHPYPYNKVVRTSGWRNHLPVTLDEEALDET